MVKRRCSLSLPHKSAGKCMFSGKGVNWGHFNTSSCNKLGEKTVAFRRHLSMLLFFRLFKPGRINRVFHLRSSIFARRNGRTTALKRWYANNFEKKLLLQKSSVYLLVSPPSYMLAEGLNSEGACPVVSLEYQIYLTWAALSRHFVDKSFICN